jgi:alpha-tubulin suppressor-like RCC1 family protein
MQFLASSGARHRVQCCAGGFAMMLAVAVHVLSPSGAAARDGAAAVALSVGSPIAAGGAFCPKCGSHTCALTKAGGAKCWGSNLSGEIGDGTKKTRLAPVDVKNLTSGVAAIAAGAEHTCALTTAGGVKCWGYNRWGEIGDGTMTTRLAPVDVKNLTSGVAAIAAGAAHTCAVTAAGGAKCWSSNGNGVIGNGTTTDRRGPVDVVGLTSGVAAIAGGAAHTCALTAAGGVKCWGWNPFGQIGDGTTTDRLTPVKVKGF